MPVGNQYVHLTICCEVFRKTKLKKQELLMESSLQNTPLMMAIS